MRPQPRRGVMRLVVATLAFMVAAPAAQSQTARIDAASRAVQTMLERWLGPVPPSPHAIAVTPNWPVSSGTMDVESQVAYQVAQRYWTQHPTTPLMNGVARYLQSRVVAQMFDLATGHAGSGIQTVPLFGGLYTHPIAALRFDGPAAGLGNDDDRAPITRAALAFASLEQMVGQPRLIGALRSVMDAAPASDADVIRLLQDALGQEIAWLFDSVIDPSRSMNYRIAAVNQESCAPAPCHRVRIAVAHDGQAAFRDIEVRVDFEDGQSPSLIWDGLAQSRTVVFEGPSAPVRVRVDPERVNLLDDNPLDQSKEFGATTNAPIRKWIARWAVWLQDAMLACTAFV